MHTKDVLTVFNERYACKKFDSSKKIEANQFEVIMEAARLSPSSCGMEPWKFLLIENADVKNDIKDFSWGALNSLNGASHFVIGLSRKNVVAESDYVRYISEEVKGIPYDQSKQQLDFFTNFQKNDFKLLDDPRYLFDWSSKQSYIALANMMTAAQMLGIDSCPIEGFDKQKLDNYLANNGYMNPDDFGVSYMVSFGYRNEVRRQKQRLPMSDIFEIIE